MTIKKGLTSTLRHKITIEKPVLTPDEAGGYTKTWENVTDLWAAIIRKSGREEQFGGKITAQNACIFRVRYTNLVTSDMRIQYGDRMFNIRSLHNIEERNELLEILAEEGVAV